MPEARGDVRSIIGQPFFVPLYNLFLAYGGVFMLSFGPKVSEEEIAGRLSAGRQHDDHMQKMTPNSTNPRSCSMQLAPQA